MIAATGLGCSRARPTARSNPGVCKFRLRLPWLMASAATFFLVMTARFASGSDARVRITLSYRVAPGCPTASDFRAEVTARTEEAAWASPSEVPDRALDVSVVGVPGKFEGRLRIQKANAPSSVRQISGESCDEVIEALALVAALAIDPHALTSPLHTPLAEAGGAHDTASEASNEASRVAAAQEAPPQTKAPAVATAAAAPVVLSSAAKGAAPELTLPSRSETRAAWHAASGLGAAVISGVLPSATLAGRGFFELAPSPRIFFPMLRLDATAALQGWKPAGPGFTQSLWFTSELEACPVSFALGPRLRVAPCVFGDLGLLRSQGRIGGQSGVTTQTRPWIALGILGRLRWSLSDAFFVDISGGLRAPLVRDTLIFDAPQRVVLYAVPVVGAEASLGLGYRFAQ